MRSGTERLVAPAAIQHQREIQTPNPDLITAESRKGRPGPTRTTIQSGFRIYRVTAGMGKAGDCLVGRKTRPWWDRVARLGSTGIKKGAWVRRVCLLLDMYDFTRTIYLTADLQPGKRNQEGTRPRSMMGARGLNYSHASCLTADIP